MDTTRFLDYLQHPATANLADSLAEVIATRRASAARRAIAGLQTIPARIDDKPRMRAAS